MKRYREQQKEGPQKKSKVTKPPLNPITLRKCDLDEIWDKLCDTIAELLQRFEQQHLYSLCSIQKDLCKLQIQTNRIQLGTGKVSTTQMSLAPGTNQDVEMVKSMDL